MPDDPKPTPRWTGWQRAAVALAAGLLLTVLGTGLAVAVGGSDDPARPAVVPTPPPAPPAFIPPMAFGGPGDDPGAPWAEVEADERDEVTRFFTRFGAAVRDPRNDLADVFWYHDLMPPAAGVDWNALDPEDAQDAERFGRAIVRRERADWRTWDWAKTDVRRVTREPGGTRYEAVVWHTAKDGTRVKRRWTLMNKFDAGAPAPDDADVSRFAALGWEDLHTGVTAWDLAVVEAAAGGRARKTRDVGRFREVFAVYRALDAGKIDDARKAVESLQRARFEPDQQYAVDLAEARFLRRVGNTADALELCEELVQRDRLRVAAHLLLAELLLDAERYDRVKEVVVAYTAVVGDDPDALALTAEAHYRLVETDDATAALEQVRKFDPCQPRLLNWERRGLTAERKQEVADKLAKAPRPERLFDLLAAGAEADEDWGGLVALSQKYRELRPADHRGAAKLILARSKQGKPDEVTAVFRDAVKKLEGDDQARLADVFVNALIDRDNLEEVYDTIPNGAYGITSLAEKLLNRANPNYPGTAEEETPAKRKAAFDQLTRVIEKYRKVRPGDWTADYYDGMLKSVTDGAAAADKVFAAALAKLRFTGDAEKDSDSGYTILTLSRCDTLYALGRGLEAYRTLRPHAEVFDHLIERYRTSEDTDGLVKLLDERDKLEPGAEARDFWWGEVNWRRKKYAEVAANYRAFLDSDDNPRLGLIPVRTIARERLVRSLVRLGKPDEAVNELPTDEPSALLIALVQAATGKPDVAEQTLRAAIEKDPNLVPKLYADEDLGPLLKGKAFARFREDFPPPDDEQDKRHK